MNNDSCYYQEYMAITATVVKVVGEDEKLAVKVSHYCLLMGIETECLKMKPVIMNML